MRAFSPHSLDLKGMKLEGQTRRRWFLMRRQRVIAGREIGGQRVRSNRPRKAFMKTGTKRLDVSRRSSNGIQRRIKTLKGLIPNTESTELDGLFRETADYILTLQMRVRVMQIMVQVLKGSNGV